MITATKKFRFEMAHMLSKHPSLCRNVHGHSYVLEVTAIANNNDCDMVVDFSDLKQLVNSVIVDKMDHAFAYDNNSIDECENEIVAVLHKYNKKIIPFYGRPTAEIMCQEIFRKLSDAAQGQRYSISKVRLYETESGWVEYAD